MNNSISTLTLAVAAVVGLAAACVFSPAHACTTLLVGKKASAPAQIARKSSQREEAAAKREGTDRTPGEYAKDLTPRNQPCAISAARKRTRGGGA